MATNLQNRVHGHIIREALHSVADGDAISVESENFKYLTPEAADELITKLRDMLDGYQESGVVNAANKSLQSLQEAKAQNTGPYAALSELGREEVRFPLREQGKAENAVRNFLKEASPVKRMLAFAGATAALGVVAYGASKLFSKKKAPDNNWTERTQQAPEAPDAARGI